MKRFVVLAAAVGLIAPAGAMANVLTDWTAGDSQIQGHYLEARTCDVYTGPCFANGEVGETGEEALMTWSVDKGTWNGVSLDGLNVIAAVRAENTLGDKHLGHGLAKAVLVVDARANEAQNAALQDMARRLGGDLLDNVVAVKEAPMEVLIGACSANGCGIVKAADFVEIDTRCLKNGDEVCGNEETFYKPLTNVRDSMPAFTNIASFQSGELGVTWNDAGSRSAFLATFSH